MRYSHWSPTESVDTVVAHVRAHLSSIASPADDPDAYADQVAIRQEDQAGGVMVHGELDAEPAADYLRDDWTPEQDVAINPLSVLSVLSVEDES